MSAKVVTVEGAAGDDLEALDTRTTCTPILRTPSVALEDSRRLL